MLARHFLKQNPKKLQQWQTFEDEVQRLRAAQQDYKFKLQDSINKIDTYRRKDEETQKDEEIGEILMGPSEYGWLIVKL